MNHDDDVSAGRESFAITGSADCGRSRNCVVDEQMEAEALGHVDGAISELWSSTRMRMSTSRAIPETVASSVFPRCRG